MALSWIVDGRPEAVSHVTVIFHGAILINFRQGLSQGLLLLQKAVL